MTLVRLLGCVVVVASSGIAHAEPVPEAQWQALGQADLQAIRDTIGRAHPGAIDAGNPGFRSWMENGYHDALALLSRVHDYDSMLDAVRYYVVGFQDGHLFYSDSARPAQTRDAPFPIIGWKVRPDARGYLVSGAWPGFPVQLPPTGSRLVDCDGEDPATIYRRRIAPYFDVRPLPVDRESVARQLGMPALRGDELRRCRFETPQGTSLDLDVAYVPMPLAAALAFLSPEPRPRRINRYTFSDGVLWIQAATFDLDAAEAESLDAMLEEIRRLRSVRAIVFDTRGNGGGDSEVGARIFDAATGGLQYDRRELDRLPRVYAQWRVSDVSLSTAAEQVTKARELYGDRRIDAALAFWDELRRARVAGSPWVEQWDGAEGGYRIDRAEIIRRHGRLKSFNGKVVLLTDSHCASSCLDFADLVRLVPGALHVGQTTSADSIYIDVGFVKLPSGNYLMLPLKVWRNRLRGNNEPLAPDVAFDVDMDDDAAVVKITRAALAGQ